VNAAAKWQPRRIGCGEEDTDVESEPLAWEALVASLVHELPQPVKHETALDGATVFVGGDPGEVVVRLTDAVLTVSEFAVEWQGPHTPVTRPIELGRVHWQWLPGVDTMRVLLALGTSPTQSPEISAAGVRAGETT
jgi:hypothetical protein